MKHQRVIPQLPEKGVLCEIVADLVPVLSEPKKSKIIVVGCGLKIHYPWDKACARFHSAVEEIRKATAGFPIEIISAPEPFEDADEMIRFTDSVEAASVAGVIFFHAAYTAGEVGSHFGRWLLERSVPVLSWAWPEPGTRGRNEANSLTCQNFIVGMWHQMGIRYAWMHKSVDDSAHPFIDRYVRAVYAKHQFSHARLLHAGGSRVTAFYDGEVDELAVMKNMGARFDRVDLEFVHQHARKFKEKDLLRLKDALVNHPSCSHVDLPDEQILQTYRFGLGMLDLAAENGYLGATVKSWPDLFDCYGCAIDGSVSMLNDFGFCVAEEGEMNGLLSSLALQFVSDGKAIPTMMDLSLYNEGEDSLGLWHCGACPTRLLRKGEKYAATRHSILENGNIETAVGLMVEFLLEKGPITILRYQAPKADCYFSFEGEIVESGLAYRGNYGKMIPREGESMQDIIGTILTRGLDHHWSVGYGHWNEEIQLLNHFMGIQEMPRDGFTESFGVNRN